MNDQSSTHVLTQILLGISNIKQYSKLDNQINLMKKMSTDERWNINLEELQLKGIKMRV